MRGGTEGEGGREGGVETERRGVGTERGRGGDGGQRCIGESQKNFVHLLISSVSTTQQNASMLNDKP